MADPDNVVRFPFKLRDSLPPPAAAVLHDGRRYEAESLMRQLPPHSMMEVGAGAPADLQAFWDEVVRRWPELADDIVARAGQSAD